MAGIGGWYDFQQTIAMPYGPFGLSIQTWGIIIAAIGTGLIIFQLQRRIRSLENDRPSISVSPKEFRNTFYLDVTNKGAAACFEAQITLLSVRIHGDWISTQEFFPWQAVWESNNKNEVEIKQNHNDSVVLIHVGQGVSGHPTLKLWAYDMNTKSCTILKEFSTPEIAVNLRINISSDPSPKNGVFDKNYQITAFDMVEIKSKILKNLKSPQK